MSSALPSAGFPSGNPFFPSATSQPGGNGGNNSGSNLFSSAAGPPLILVFLAAGLLIGGAIALCTVGRMRRRRAALGELVPLKAVDNRVVARPVLRDVYMQTEQDCVQWAAIMPISAQVIPGEAITPTPARKSSRSSRAWYHGITSYVRPYDPPLPLHVEPDNGGSSDMMEEGRLRVVMTIAMPSPPDEGSRVVANATSDYNLGLAEVRLRTPGR